ncbi:amino acid adenylation domain-containing protein [Streptomyces sp. WAC05374]|uniref:non-ribosomal peptide synthetase/type I polyketide synthase n=1 Tax=Streptomyces sp. WAC05374 TaxID=2487420 RepID=UPI000F88F54D|nr:non-ribosomal peptide synthetase/type I polyketide synthase [Streptomyces sp. WAC05374]RST18379.1 amino acid adenylation domain-containing protein [Streptomyces sp. WAC05374]TDF36205.1 amino acid adenylation domain-containing protein [Streptomyces sp. WAC05374]TDF45723.1 amino acid adenylation domain-containing protein [Streptomyces sp. WAC05374]TDF46648.1 amino acid adenylation domain-containing protein [Streptomyces sp. WAC05374]
MNAQANEERLRRAMAAVLQLQQRNAELENQRHEPVAIVAMACRLPGGVDTPRAFWDLLVEERDAIGPLPSRWDAFDLYDPDPGTPGKSYAREGGFLDGVEKFDAEFFGISPREAQSMEPQQRVVLEASWEALERAGLRSDQFKGSRTGVYIGAMRPDYETIRTDLELLDGYQGTGVSCSVISGRVSYALGLQGPAVTVDTACSSSLVAIHLAATALRNGECDMALAGGVTVMSSPGMFVESSRLGAMSPDGRCKSFSAEADGGGWSEGVGILVLKRLSAAQRDGDRVLAVIRGSAVNQDGRSQGLTAPNGPAQQRVIQDALAASRLTPSDIDAIEAHGTGTPLGDPIEAGALAGVFAPGRDAGEPVYLGSSKSNIGHCQAAAGVVGVMKMVLALQHETLPKTLHAERPSPHIAWDGSGLELLREARAWSRGERTRRAGVSAFGISGTNAHVVLEEAPVPEETDPAAGTTAPDGLPATLPLVLSGHDEQALGAQAGRWASWLEANPDVPFADLVRTAALHRSHGETRASVLAAGAGEAVAALRALADGLPHPDTVVGSARERGKAVFVFPGQGSQWAGMGRALLAESEVFRRAVERCDAALKPYTGWSVLELLRGDTNEDLPSLERIDVLQPALFAVMIGLAELWRSLGVEPAAVVGSSQGEVPAAVVAGALSLEDGARLTALRSQGQLRECSGRGAMALVEMPLAEVEALIAPYGQALSVAVVNTAASAVVSGDVAAIESLLEELAGRDVFSRRIQSDTAGHSAHVDPVLPWLAEQLAGIEARPARVPFYSTVTGGLLDGTRLDADYWCRNVRDTVRMDLALGELVAGGHDVFVEISPHPVLSMPLTSATADVHGVVVGSLSRDRGGLSQVLRSVGALHVQGHRVDWSRVLGGGPAADPADAPTYPFQRRYYWADVPAPASTTRPAAPKQGAPDGTADGGGPRKQGGLRGRLAALADHERLGALTDIVRREAAAVLGAAQPVPGDKRLQELGLDSIMGLQLRNRLCELAGSTLPTNIAFTFPTAEDLAEHLLSDVLAAAADDAGPLPLVRAAARDVHPATEGQRRLWFLEQMNPGSAQYKVALRIRTARPLDHTTLTRSLEWITARHEALRTGLETRDGELVQVVRTGVPVAVTFADLRDLGPDALDEHLRHEEQEPFLLGGTSLFRCRVLDLAADDQVVCFSVHHAVTDGWSLSLFLMELFHAYEEYAAGREPDPAQAEFHLGDYAAWEQRSIAEGRFEEALGFFATELEGVERLELPPGPDTVAEGDEGGDTLYFTVPADLRAGLEALASRTSVTPYTVLVSAFATLLARTTDQYDFAVGTVWSSRQLPGTAGTFGFLANTLPLRCDLTGDPRFDDLLAAMSPRVRGVFEHQSVPLTEVVRAVGAARTGDENPLFRAVFNYGGAAMPTVGEGDAAWHLPSSGSLAGNVRGASKFELGITLIPCGDELRGEFEYQAHVMGRAAAQRMVANFRTLLESIVREPELPLSAHALLADEELAWLVERGGRVTPHAPGTATALELVWDQVRRTPDAVALVSGGHELTYREMAWRAAALADKLRAAGVGPETPVGVHLPRSAELVVSALAIWLAGGAYLPVDPGYPQARVAYVVEDSGIDVVITRDATAADLTGTGVRVLLADDIHDAPVPAGEALPDITAPALGDLAYVIYTSGSTGRPKGVLIEHSQFVNFCHAVDERIGGGPGDTWLAVTSPSFDISTVELLWTLTRGYRVVIAQGSVGEWSSYRSYAPTHLQCTPSLARLLLADSAGRALLRGLDRMIVGGEALDRGLAARLMSTCRGGLTNIYGPSETTVWSTTWHAEPGEVSLGDAVRNTSLYLLDRYGSRVPRGSRGELFIGGLGVTRGYLNRPELTAERFVRDPFAGDSGARMYGTGDIVRYREDGSLEYCGRSDAQIKLYGHRIELGEIEAVAGEHPAVAECAAVVRRDEGSDPRLCLYYVPSGAHGTDEDELLRYFLARVPSYMVPSQLVAMDELPHTPNKKVDRKAILALPAPGPVTAPAAQGGDDSLEDLIARAWAGVLNLTRVDRDRGFFELGASSMTALQAHKVICEGLGREFPLSALFRYPTVRQLSAFLRGASHATAPDRAPVRRGASADEPVAVIGFACRLPGAPDADTFWTNLKNGTDSIRHFTPEELRAAGIGEDLLSDPDYVPAKGHVEDATRFDADFFDCSPAEAEAMDPQHRLFLECSWQALEHAGQVPQRFDGAIGVFAGSGQSGYRGSDDATDVSDFYRSMVGTKNDFLATRVAHKLNLRGPALTVQTACSTSLVATHLARESLLRGESDIALAGGVSLTFPMEQGYVHQAGLVFSPDGACRAFDAAGAGTVLANGAGVVVLRRLSDALAAGDTVYAVLRGSAINNDGSSKVGFTAPSVEGQARVIAAAHRDAGVTADTIGYVEAHGTGTALGDPIEVQALQQVLATTGRAEPCALGSVKTNIGHTDAAAGVAGLIKAVLSLHHRQLVPSLHFDKPNPEMELDPELLYVNTELKHWKQADGPRRAGVSAFGLGGTNAHVVLEEPPVAEPVETAVAEGPLPVVVSGRDEAALREQAGRWASWLSGRGDVAVADVAVTAARHRTHFESRASVVAADSAELVEALTALSEGRPHDAVVTGSAERRGKVVFVYPGGGTQWAGMGRELLASSDVFAQTIDACDAALRPFTGWSVREVLAGERADHPPLDRADVAQPALFAMGVGLSAVWRSLGVEPAAVVGHSQGEVVAAVVSGALSLEQGAQVIAQRSRAALACVGQGGMALIERPVAQVEEFLAPYGEALSVAAVNTEGSTVISGQVDAIARIVDELGAKDVYARKINVDYASHSAQVDPILPGLAEDFASLTPRRTDIAFHSTVTGRVAEGPELDGTYWCRNLREPVRLDKALNGLLTDGHTVFVEISAHPVLTMALTDGSAGHGGVVVGSLARGHGTVAQLLRNVGLLHAHGHELDWDRVLGEHTGTLVNLPTYAFQREHYWREAHRASSPLGSRAAEALWEAVSSGGPSRVMELLDAPERLEKSVADVLPLLEDWLRKQAVEAAAEQRSPSAHRGRGIGFRERLAGAAAGDRLPMALELVLREAAQALGVPSGEVAVGRPLFQLGMDSLMAVGVRSRLARETGLSIPVQTILGEEGCLGIAGHLVEELVGAGGAEAASGASGRWLRTLKPAKEPYARIVCIAGGGGTTAGHVPLIRHVPDGVELLGVQMPGRESRTGEDPATSMRDVVAAISAELTSRTPVPTVVYGHSQGSWMAWELAHALSALPDAPALTLVPACAMPPYAEVPPAMRRMEDLAKSLDGITAGELARALEGILPDDVLASEELLTTYASALHHDAILSMNHRESLLGAEREPLRIPVVAVTAKDDPVLPEETARGWQHLTRGEFVHRVIDGSHAAPIENSEAMAAELVAAMQKAMGEKNV